VLTTLCNSSYVNVALEMENTRQHAATMMSKANGELNKVSFEDSSALCRAAMAGQMQVVRELLHQPGIDPKFDGNAALHCACKSGHLGVVKLLVEYGATIDVTDNKGMTPFLKAASSDSLTVLEYIEEQGADINTVTEDGRTILHVAAAGNSVKILEHLLQSPKLTHSLLTKSRNGLTVLLCAAQAGCIDTTRFVLERSSRPEILSKTDDGHTCLHYAVMSGKSKMLSLFQGSGICHHDQTKEGYTALHYAAKASDYIPMRTLLIHIDRTSLATQNPLANPVLIGGSVTIPNYRGVWTIDDFISGRQLDLATNSGKTALQLVLTTDPFTHVHLSMLKELVLCDGIDLERIDREKKTPLVALASRLSNDYSNEVYRLAIRELLDRGVDPNAQDISGRTALHYLCDARRFGPFIFQAIVDLIGIKGWLVDVFLSGGPPPPPPGGGGSPLPPNSGTLPGSRGRIRSGPRTLRKARWFTKDGGPPPGTIIIIGSSPPRKPAVSSNKSDIARVDILDLTKETALQAFFRNLDRTYNQTFPVEIAIRLLDLNPKDELDRQLPNGSRLFNIAIRFKNDRLIKKLYDLGINTKERDSTSEFRSPLELFCINGARDVEVFRKLISNCKYLTELDFSGLSLLHLASTFGHLKVVRELLNGGIDVNIECRNQTTALSYAVSGGHTAIVELLLDSNATTKVDCSVQWRASLLSRATNITICRLLNDRGINDWTEKTLCSFHTVFIPHFSTSRPGSNDSTWVSRLIKDLTPLHHAAFRGCIDVFKYVVEYIQEINIDVEAEFGIIPLFFAIICQKNSLVKFLLAHGAKPDAVYKPAKWTMLHLAAFIGNNEIITDLLAYGADPCAVDQWFLTPSIIALQMHHLHVSSRLQDAEKLECEYIFSYGGLTLYDTELIHD
jgi:ankyrin repeat protein